MMERNKIQFLSNMKSNKNIKEKKIEQQVTNVSYFSLKRSKDFMCVEIRYVRKVEKIGFNLASLSVSTKMKKKMITMDEKKRFCCLEKQ